MIHPPDCGCDTYGCQLRRKAIQLSPQATPSRRNMLPPSVSVPPSHWANVAYQERPGGHRMPLLKANGDPIRHREYQANQHAIHNKLAAVQAGHIREVDQ